MKAWQIKKYGGSDVFELNNLSDPEPKEGWILIEIKAFGINRSELYTRQGHSGDAVTLPRVLGIECVGIVLNGGGTELKPGQKVAACMGNMGRAYDGGYAEKTLIPRSNVFPIETNLEWEVLGAIPETYLTAWSAIHEAIGLEKNTSLLIRGGTSAAGLASACIAKEMGCTVLSTSRSLAKKESMENAGVDHILIDKGEIAGDVKAIIEEGVAGVIEFVGIEKTILDCLQSTAPKGTVCMVGFLGDTWDYKFFPWMPSTVNLTMYTSESLNEKTATPALQAIVDHVSAGRYIANIHKVFDFSQLPEAHDTMEQNKASGKLVVRV